MTVGSRKRGVGYYVITVVAVLITIVMIFPLYWMVATHGGQEGGHQQEQGGGGEQGQRNAEKLLGPGGPVQGGRLIVLGRDANHGGQVDHHAVAQNVTALYSLGEIFATLVGGMVLALIFSRMTRGFSAWG